MKPKQIIVCLFACIVSFQVFAQNEIYRLRWGLDVPVASVGVGTTITSFVLHKHKQPLTESQVLGLNIMDINRFDRSATRQYSTGAKYASDVLMFGAMATPSLMLIDKNFRADWKTVLPITLESYALTMGITGLTKELVKRKRPYVYNPDVPMDKKLEKDATSSFFSGHTSLTATSCFLTAKFYADYHPDSRWKPLVWTSAAIVPALTGLLRYKAGKHYWTDILTGYAVGATVGLLVPVIHKVRN